MSHNTHFRLKMQNKDFVHNSRTSEQLNQIFGAPIVVLLHDDVLELGIATYLALWLAGCQSGLVNKLQV